MIFSRDEKKLFALEDEVQNLRARVRQLERDATYTQDNESISLSRAVREIAKHLNMKIVTTRPIDSHTEFHFGEKE